MQEYFGQNKEDKIVLDYFGDEKICVLSIGENNGEHLSNVRALLLNGSFGTLVEPSPKAFAQLVNLYKDRPDIYCLNVAVSDRIGKADFYDSGTHLNSGDTSLLSSLNKDEIKKWQPVTSFEKIKVDVVDFHTLLYLQPYNKFDFISIDAESEDLTILRQTDLASLGCRMLCIEWNGKEEVLNEIKAICARFGLNETLLKNLENVIMAAPK